MNNWNWSTPITLSTHRPITHFIIYFRASKIFLFKFLDYFLAYFLRRLIVVLARVNHYTFVVTTFIIRRSILYYTNNWQIKLFGKLVITLVVCWHGHYSARTITC